MPLTVNKVANDTASVTLQIGEDTLTIVYFPSRITEKTFAQLNLFANANENTIEAGFEAFNEVLASLIKDWDYYEDDQETIKVATTPDRLSEVPIPLRGAILQAIIGDVRPNLITPQIRNS